MNPSLGVEGPRCVMVNVLDCGIKASEFELQSSYYVQSRIKTLGKGMDSLSPPKCGLNSTTTVLLQGWLCVLNPIYPTTPLGQDMTQGQFLSGF